MASNVNKADRHKSRARVSISHYAEKKVKCHGEADRPTDGPTNGLTDTVAYRVACARLKNIEVHGKAKARKSQDTKKVSTSALSASIVVMGNDAFDCKFFVGQEMVQCSELWQREQYGRRL